MRSRAAPGTIRRVRTTVLIVDDHEDYRRSASALLEAEGFVVVGEAADGAAAIEASHRVWPFDRTNGRFSARSASARS